MTPLPLQGDRSAENAQIRLAHRLYARQAEIESAVFAQISALIPRGFRDSDLEYIADLRIAIREALIYALGGIEHGALSMLTMPAALMVHARRDARKEIALDTVLRRYVAGDKVFSQFILDEADNISRVGLRALLCKQADQLDELLAAVSAEYAAERELLGRSAEQRTADAVRGLLHDEHAKEADGLDYDFDRWHVGIVGVGPSVGDIVRRVAHRLSLELLVIADGERTVWGWLSAGRTLATRDLERAFSEAPATDAVFAAGEPACGITGWRQTHHQAQAALRVGLLSHARLTGYAGVVLLSAALRDPITVRSLHKIYLAPLGSQRDGGTVLRQTLLAYFAASQNASSSAVALGVTRHTVENRLRRVEQLLGRTIPSCQAELSVALRLDALAPPDDSNHVSATSSRGSSGD